MSLLLIIIIMLVQTPHINNQLLSLKQKVVLSKDRPLLLIISSSFRFFSTFVKTILELYDYPVKIQTIDHRQVMDFTLPILCFDGYLLAKENLVEFISDIAFTNLPFDQYVLRKENIKTLYQSWQPIFAQESFIPSKGDLEKITKDKIPNKLYSNFIHLSQFVVSKGYQRVFSSYDDRNINAEAIFAIDVVDTIINDCSREDIDYTLRGDFEALINFCRIYKQRLRKGEQMEAIKEQQEMNIDKDGEKYVLIDQKRRENSAYPTLSFNLKWFAGMAVLLSFIFGKWAK